MSLTCVFGLDPLIERIEVGYPLLYPLIREGRLQLLSADSSPPDPRVTLYARAGFPGRQKPSWQAIVLIPECREGDTLSHVEKVKNSIEAQHLNRFIDLYGNPQRTWIIWVADPKYAMHTVKSIAEAESPVAEVPDNCIYLRLNPTLASSANTLPFILSALAQWRPVDAILRQRYWQLSTLDCDEAAFSNSLQRYQNTLQGAQKGIADKLKTPLNSHVALIDANNPETAAKLPPPEIIPDTRFRTQVQWNQWKLQAQEMLAQGLERGQSYLHQHGDGLRRLKGGKARIQIKDLDQKIKEEANTRTSAWEMFRGKSLSSLYQNWHERIGSVAYRIREYFLCRPTLLRRWLTVAIGLLLLLLPMLIILASTPWDRALWQRLEVKIFLGYGLIAGLGVMLLLEIRSQWLHRKLARDAHEIAETMLKETHKNTIGNADYLTSAFTLSAATINLETLQRVQKKLLEQRQQWQWFQSEMTRHLDWSRRLQAGRTITATTDQTTDWEDIKLACSLPCSRSPLFSLPLGRNGGTLNIHIHIGTAPSQTKGVAFPGELTLNLEIDGH